MRRFGLMVPGSVQWRLLLAFIALATCLIPIANAVLAWNTTGKLTDLQYRLVHHSIPTLVVECMIVVFALMSGMRLSMVLRKWTAWQRYFLCLVFLSAVISAAIIAFGAWSAWRENLIWGLHFSCAVSVRFISEYLDEADWRRFWFSFVAGVAGYIVLVAFFVAAVPHPNSYPWALRLPGVTNVRHIGYFLAAAIAVLLASGYAVAKKANRIVHLLALGLLVIFGCWTGSRGIFISLGVGVLATACLVRETRRLERWPAIVAVMMLSAFVSAFIPVPAPNFGIFNRMVHTEYRENSTLDSGRVRVWKETAAHIAERPLTGFGAGQFRSNMRAKVGAINHPHNIILQVVYQWGIPGGAAFLCLLSTAWWASVKETQERGRSVAPAFLVLNVLLVYSAFDGAAYYPFPILLMIIAFGAITGSRCSREQ